MEQDKSSYSGKKLVNAAKWSTFTEIVTKLVSPISSMILARILVPEVFGIVASVNMVLSFCDVFADAGFQKYIIQNTTEDQEESDKIATVAFWTNLILSVAIWMVVCVFASPIAKLVGCEGHDLAVCIACIHLPLHAFSSIPNAKLKREMDFRTLFVVRLVSIFTPFAITLPIALITKSYWALIIGNLVNNFLVAVVALCKVKWKPKLYYSFHKLKEMLSFSLWSMLESILVWLINWGDMFIVTMFLTPHYLGIYKTSINMVNSILAVISSSLMPVMLSALSRLQDNQEEFKRVYHQISFYSGLLLLPMGVGMFVYRNTMCDIILGNGWSDGALLMGIWGFVSALSILFNTYNGCVYIAKGKPKISAIVQFLQILVIIPAVYFSVQVSFECLSYSRALIRLVSMLIHCFVTWKFFSLSVFKTLKNLLPSILATLVMAFVGGWLVSLNLGMLFDILGIFVCVLVYFGVVCLFPSVRVPIWTFARKTLGKKKKVE